MKEIKNIHLPEVSQEEFLQSIKDYLVECKEEQRILGNKVRHYEGILNRTKDFHIG